MEDVLQIHEREVAREDAGLVLFKLIVRALEETGEVQDPSFEEDEKVMGLARLVRAITAEVFD